MQRACSVIPSAVAIGVALILGLPSGAAAQSTVAEGSEAAPAADWTFPRTSWGAPDLQGVWDYRTMTPLERPRELAGKATLTAEEAAAYEQRQNELLDDYDRSPSVHAKWWLDYGRALTGDRRTSLVVDPPDGRLPAVTEDARQRAGGALRAPPAVRGGRGGVPWADGALHHVRHAATSRRLQQQLPDSCGYWVLCVLNVHVYLNKFIA